MRWVAVMEEARFWNAAIAPDTPSRTWSCSNWRCWFFSTGMDGEQARRHDSLTQDSSSSESNRYRFAREYRERSSYAASSLIHLRGSLAIASAAVLVRTFVLSCRSASAVPAIDR